MSVQKYNTKLKCAVQWFLVVRLSAQSILEHFPHPQRNPSPSVVTPIAPFPSSLHPRIDFLQINTFFLYHLFLCQLFENKEVLQLTLDILHLLQDHTYCSCDSLQFRKYTFLFVTHWSNTLSTTNSSGSASPTLLLFPTFLVFPFCFFPTFCDAVLLEAIVYCRLKS